MNILVNPRQIYQIFASDRDNICDGFYRIVMCIEGSRYLHVFRMPEPKSLETLPDVGKENEISSDDGEAITKKGEPVRRPYAIRKDVFTKILEEQRAKLIEEYACRELNPDRDLSESHKKMFNENKRLLAPLVHPENLFRMLECGEYSMLIRGRAAICISESGERKESSSMNGVDSSSERNITTDSLIMRLRRLLSRFFECGMDLKTACTPRARRQCKDARRKRKVTRKLGRPNGVTKTNHSTDKAGVNSLDFEKDVVQFWKLLSEEDKKLSYAEQHRRFQARYGSKAVSYLDDGTLVRFTYEKSQFITPGQYRYIVQREIGRLKVKKAEVSRRFSQQYRAILSDARNRIGFPSQVYIIDSTIGDVYLVAAYDRRLLIGRPVIYVIIDAFSSLIVGIHVTLEGPNFEQAQVALSRALRKKDAWLRYLNLTGLRDFFPQACRFTSLFGDRGEQHSAKSRQDAEEHSYIDSIAAPYRPDWKSLVERNFGVMNQMVIHWLPGAVRERARERGNRDVRLDAVLTLYEFTRLFVIECAKWNGYKDMSKHITAPMIRVGLEASPLSFWDWGLQNRHGSATFDSHEESLARIMPLLPVTVNRRGVFQGDLRYVADWMYTHPAILGPGLGFPTKVGMYRDPDNPLFGYCKLSGEKELRQMKLVFEKDFSDPYTLEDIIDFEALNRLNGQERKIEVAPEINALKRLQEDVVTEASAATESAHAENPMSKTSRKANVKKNRKIDSARNRNGVATSQAGESSEAENDHCSILDANGIPISKTDGLIRELISKWDDPKI